MLAFSHRVAQARKSTLCRLTTRHSNGQPTATPATPTWTYETLVIDFYVDLKSTNYVEIIGGQT